MRTLRLVDLDDPLVSSLAARITMAARASTKAIAVLEAGRFIEALAIQTLDWDTRILGIKTGRITDGVGSTSDSRYPGLVDHLRSLGLEYVTVRRPSEEDIRLRAFEEAGFRLVDGILSFSKALKASSVATNVRAARADETDRLAALAVSTFKRSRFHRDEVLSKDAADKIHDEWMRNSCSGVAAKAVLVFDDAGRSEGFITCKISAKQGVGVIDLVGVAPGSGGRGIGRALVEGACEWFALNGCSSVQVQTQIDNHAAIRLYSSTGFAPEGTFVTLRWSAK